MVSRRALLLGLGTTALVGVAGGTVFATTRTPQAALAPWQSPGALAGDPRIKALEWAVLAPSPHNRQPWLVALDGDDTATIYCDLERRLPMTDPFDRQIVIGLGAFLELFVLAARNAGSDVAVELFPEGAAEMPNRLDDRPVARLVLTPGGTADP
ncbi:MAG: twin-arginine translocation pathway signal protein, partial [Pseudomonadota bacterium]